MSLRRSLSREDNNIERKNDLIIIREHRSRYYNKGGTFGRLDPAQ